MRGRRARYGAQPMGSVREALRRLGKVARHLVNQLGLGLLAGVPAGVASFIFLELLDAAIEFRVEQAPWLLWLLPAGAFVIVAVYHHLGGRAALGTTLVIEQVHESNEDIPLRMAPLVMLATVGGHLFGASVGREGTAIQMAASLSDGVARLLRFSRFHRRELLVAAVAAGFGSVFGIPVAGAVFALEVQTIGRLRYEAVLAAFTAALAGDQVVRWLGHEHALRPNSSPRSTRGSWSASASPALRSARPQRCSSGRRTA